MVNYESSFEPQTAGQAARRCPVNRRGTSVLKQILALAAICLSSLNGLYGAESLQLAANENLFAVMAAANAAGYDDGIALPDNSPLRQQLRDYLAKQNIPVLPD